MSEKKIKIDNDAVKKTTSKIPDHNIKKKLLVQTQEEINLKPC